MESDRQRPKSWIVLGSICRLSKAVAPEARSERAVMEEGWKPEVVSAAKQAERRREVMWAEGRPTAQRKEEGVAGRERR